MEPSAILRVGMHWTPPGKKARRKTNLATRKEELRDGMQKRRCGWTESANERRGRKQKTGNSAGI